MAGLMITQADMELFSCVSHDINPLHISSHYARRTPFGEPVVFGILGALASLQQAPIRTGYALNSVSLLFLNPLFVGIEYRVHITESGSEPGADVKVEVFDGRRRVLQGAYTYRPLEIGEVEDLPDTQPTASLKKPAIRQEADLAAKGALETSGLQGDWMPPTDWLKRLMQRWQLDDKGVLPAQVAALAWTSYVVGMELPGEQAAYSRLEMKFTPQTASQTGPYTYTIKLNGYDARFNLLRLTSRLTAGDTTVAEAQIGAFLRTGSRKSCLDTLEAWLPSSERMRGKVALVIGGSRGLGATLVQALAMQGCTVYLNYRFSHEDAQHVCDSLPPGAGPVLLAPGDATDINWCHQQRALLLEQYGGLDFLICNASPAIRPLDFDPDTLDRFQEFVSKSLKLVSVPMAVFGEPLKRREGHYVVISSLYATTAPAEFPHYVAAKCAIEGLVRSVIAPEKPPYGMLVRPPKLLTDQTNTPMGKRDTILPEQIAARVVALLAEPTHSGELQIVEDFPSLAQPVLSHPKV